MLANDSKEINKTGFLFLYVKDLVVANVGVRAFRLSITLHVGSGDQTAAFSQKVTPTGAEIVFLTTPKAKEIF